MYLVIYYPVEQGTVFYAGKLDYREVYFNSFVAFIKYQRYKASVGYIAEGYTAATPNNPSVFDWYNGHIY